METPISQKVAGKLATTPLLSDTHLHQRRHRWKMDGSSGVSITQSGSHRWGSAAPLPANSRGYESSLKHVSVAHRFASNFAFWLPLIASNNDLIVANNDH